MNPTTEQIDEFYEHYILAALWSSTGDDGQSLDRDYGPEDIAQEAQAELRADCILFLSAKKHLIESEPEVRNSECSRLAQAGHDFWLTQNGHGCGFWDGDWPVNGDKLTLACEALPEVDLYVGDDGRIHV